MAIYQDLRAYPEGSDKRDLYFTEFQIDGLKIKLKTGEQIDGRALNVQKRFKENLKEAQKGQHWELYKQLRGSEKRDDRKEATQLLYMLAEGRDPDQVPASRVTLREVLAEYEATTVEKKSKGFYKTTLNQIREAMAAQLDRPVRDLTVGHVKRMMEARRKDSSAATANRARVVLHAALEIAFDDEVINVNPVRRTKAFKVPGRETRKPGKSRLWRVKKTPFPLERIDDVARACDEVCPEAWLGRMVLMTLALDGARSGEIEKLTWGDISEDYSTAILGDRKDNDDCRFVIAQFARPIIKSWGREHPDTHVFRDDEGRSITRSRRAKYWKRAQIKAGMAQPFGWQGFRNLGAQVTDEKHGARAAQAGLGHAQFATTEKNYLNGISMRHKEDAADAADSVLRECWPTR